MSRLSKPSSCVKKHLTDTYIVCINCLIDFVGHRSFSSINIAHNIYLYKSVHHAKALGIKLFSLYLDYFYFLLDTTKPKIKS
jgi:hypothetical protein